MEDKVFFIDKRGRRRRGYKRKCVNCQVDFIALDFMVLKGKGLYCSKRCHSLCRDNTPFLTKAKIKGKDHHSYKHGNGYGNQSLRKAEMSSSQYRAWRKAVFVRDNFTCQECNKRGDTLNAHHIKAWKDFPELRYEVSNGQTLCVGCHKLKRLNISE